MEVKQKVLRAFRQFMSKEVYLLAVGANERSLTHRLAVYIEQEFPDYNVDCEFQKDRREPKILERFAKSEAANSGLAYPDIIVHHRGTADNFIVIEAKTSGTHTGCEESARCFCDLCKLCAYRDELGYRHAFYVVFPVGREFKAFSFDKIESCLTQVVANPQEQVAVSK